MKEGIVSNEATVVMVISKRVILVYSLRNDSLKAFFSTLF